MKTTVPIVPSRLTLSNGRGATRLVVAIMIEALIPARRHIYLVYKRGFTRWTLYSRVTQVVVVNKLFRITRAV